MNIIIVLKENNLNSVFWDDAFICQSCLHFLRKGIPPCAREEEENLIKEVSLQEPTLKKKRKKILMPV